QVGPTDRLLTDRGVPPADLEQVGLGLLDLYGSGLTGAADVVLDEECHCVDSAGRGLGSGVKSPSVDRYAASSGSRHGSKHGSGSGVGVGQQASRRWLSASRRSTSTV